MACQFVLLLTDSDEEDDDLSAEVLIHQLRQRARISSASIEEAARSRLLSDSSESSICVQIQSNPLIKTMLKSVKIGLVI